MNIKKIAQSAGLVSRRDSRMKVVQKGRKTLQIDFMGNELEKRQLLATFSYSSNLLTIQTDSANEQLSIISTSESGNYNITTSGSWSRSASNINISGTSLFVNQPSGLASILMNDNSGAISGSVLSFGASSANFVSNLTANFTSGSSSISVSNATSFTSGKALSLTSNAIALASNITTAGTQAYTGNVTINGNVALSSGGSVITVTGKIDSSINYINNVVPFTSNATWSVPQGVTDVDLLVVAGGGADSVGGGGGSEVVERSSVSVSGTISIVVGTAGNGGQIYTFPPTNGGNSSFGSIIATGGGSSAGESSDASSLGYTGGGGTGYFAGINAGSTGTDG